MDGIPWGVMVYYDPPVPTSTYELNEQPSRLTFHAHMGHRNANLLIDTGATSSAYISTAFCRQLGLSIRSVSQDQPDPRVDPTEFRP